MLAYENHNHDYDGRPPTYALIDNPRVRELRKRYGWGCDPLLEVLREEHGSNGRPDIYPGLDE